MSLRDYLQPQANGAAIDAANAAVDDLAKRPFSVVLSVDDATKLWISVLVLGAAVLMLKRRRA